MGKLALNTRLRVAARSKAFSTGAVGASSVPPWAQNR